MSTHAGPALHIFILFFSLHPSSLPPSMPYFIVSRALRPLKRPDYKRPINSFILFALAPFPTPLPRSLIPAPLSRLFPKIERRYSHPHSFFPFFFLVHPHRRRSFAFYSFHRRGFGRGHIVVNWLPFRCIKKERLRKYGALLASTAKYRCSGRNPVDARRYIQPCGDK